MNLDCNGLNDFLYEKIYQPSGCGLEKNRAFKVAPLAEGIT